MAKKEQYPGPAEALEQYERVVATHPEVDRKGAKNPYTSRNGHMFSFLDATGMMALRLSAEMREEFLADHPTPPVEQYGAIMREYVGVPPELLADPEVMGGWLARSHDWIGTLKPKPTKKPAKKAATKKVAAKKKTAAAKKTPAKKQAATKKPAKKAGTKKKAATKKAR